MRIIAAVVLALLSLSSCKLSFLENSERHHNLALPQINFDELDTEKLIAIAIIADEYQDSVESSK